MDWNQWKDLLMKALFAAIYAALSEIVVTKSLDTSTLYVALITAAIRGALVFFATINDFLQKPQLSFSGKAEKAPKRCWKDCI